MKINQRIVLLTLLLSSAKFTGYGQSGANEPWKENQLMAPADLAKMINDGNAKKPVIFNIGPSGKIKGSIHIGPSKESDNLKELKDQLSKLPKNTSIVIYCGCCPFEHCPNIRPVFELLNKEGFTNHKLLNLSKNLKADWIDKGFPLAQ